MKLLSGTGRSLSGGGHLHTPCHRGITSLTRIRSGNRSDAETDANFMALALQQARNAAASDEVPIGAVMVRDGCVLAVRRGAGVRPRHGGHNSLIPGATWCPLPKADTRVHPTCLCSLSLPGCTHVCAYNPAGGTQLDSDPRQPAGPRRDCVHGACCPEAGCMEAARLHTVCDDRAVPHVRRSHLAGTLEAAGVRYVISCSPLSPYLDS